MALSLAFAAAERLHELIPPRSQAPAWERNCLRSSSFGERRFAGDIIYGHENHHKKLDAQYMEFFGIAQLAKVPVFNAPGNHEMDSVQKIGKEPIETPDDARTAA
jgi:hypothetical protein